MARKTMAERYATQRSSRPLRRRSLPRLSDSTTTALDVREGALEDVLDETPAAGAAATFTAGATRRTSSGTATVSRPSAAMPRRAGAAVGLERPPAGAPRVNYAYVRRDLRRIAITAVAMLVLLIVLNVVLQNIIH